MIDALYQIDVAIFYFINHTLSNPFCDKILLIVTNVKSWYIAYIILWFILFIKGGRIGKIAAISAVILIAVTDQFTSTLLKNWIARVRPCHVLENVTSLVSCKSSYSFPSAHAVNNFAIAVFFMRLYPNLKWVLLITAGVVALSRPYIGIHYPSDIVAGGLIGAIFGYLFSNAVLRIDYYFTSKTSITTEEKINENKT